MQLRGGKTSEYVITSPYGGWNTLDSLNAMPEEDAILLDNWYPDVGRVSVRRGYESHSTCPDSNPVETLFEYSAGATRKLLAMTAGKIYDATSSSTAPTVLGVGFNNSRFQCVNFGALGFLCNGSSQPQTYDGSTLTASTISGPVVTSIVGANVYKNRLYVWTTASQDFWYGATNAIGGAFTQFPLSRVAQLGGFLVAMGTWTIDAGDGLDDMAVFVMSSGEVIVYRGSDPGDAASWALAGIYRIAPPLGIRTVVKAGGDLLITTMEDHQSLTQVLTRGGVGVPLSKISTAQRTAAQSGKDNFGWQSLVYPKAGMILVNTSPTPGVYQQHVLNTLTGAWTRFVDIPAVCWGLFNDNLYFGTNNGAIFKADVGTSDNGVAINADARQAWNHLKRQNRKRITAVRVVMEAEGALSYGFGLGYDFRDAPLTTPATIVATGTPWGSAWGSPWSDEARINTQWRVAVGSGIDISPRLTVSTVQGVSWYRTDIRFESGVNL